MDKLNKEIQELKDSFDNCDFENSDTKRLFEIIEELVVEVERLQVVEQAYKGMRLAK